MIAVENLTKRYGDVLAVDDVSFEVKEGEVVGFLGPNGAGKSTTLRILTAYMPATQGSVRIAGLDVLTRSLEVRSRIGYLPETVPVYPDMRVEEFLGFRALLKGVSRSDLKARVQSALDRCGCTDMRRRMIGKLSKGYRQRVGLADAIVHDPPILILDEPTSGLDPNQRIEVRNLIASLGADKTVFLSSHILAEVEAVAERVLIIHRGRLIADGVPGELVRQMGKDGGMIRLEVRGDAEAMERELLLLGEAANVDRHDLADGFCRFEVHFGGGGDHRVEVAELARRQQVELRELTMPEANLEVLFRRLTRAAEEVA